MEPRLFPAVRCVPAWLLLCSKPQPVDSHAAPLFLVRRDTQVKIQRRKNFVRRPANSTLQLPRSSVKLLYPSCRTSLKGILPSHLLLGPAPAGEKYPLAVGCAVETKRSGSATPASLPAAPLVSASQLPYLRRVATSTHRRQSCWARPVVPRSPGRHRWMDSVRSAVCLPAFFS